MWHSSVTNIRCPLPIPDLPSPAHPLPSPGIKSRQVGITDRGNMDRTRGWYDAQCQGAANDYCRYVGDAPNVWWSCALAGSNNEYSPAGLFTEAGMRRVPC